MIKYLVTIFAYSVVLYPLWARYSTISWSANINSVIYNIFPGFGLVAFSLLWLHAISGVFEPWLRKNFNFDRFVHITATLVMICLIAHPLLAFINFGFNINALVAYEEIKYIWYGIIGWLLLITYDISRFLGKKHNFFIRHWNKILLISTIGFLFTFFHSIGVGSDLQTGSLRYVWIFYGVTAILATIYTYGYKKRPFFTV